MIEEGRGGLPKIRVQTEFSEAEIYLHGAHVTHFQKKNEAPVLFLSEQSQFTEGQAIRGGVPVIFPWFGPKEGDKMHGFARLKTWDLTDVRMSADGEIGLTLRLPKSPEAEKFPEHEVQYMVSAGKELYLRLAVQNVSKDQNFEFETCLHTYFSAGAIDAVSITGLKGRTYVDKVDNFVKKVEAEEGIRVSSEVNRIYEDTSDPIEILDTKLKRKVHVETNGGHSTVVWNPWIVRAREMPDFGDDEYLNMVCVESGNVAKNKVVLGPSQTAVLRVRLSTAAL